MIIIVGLGNPGNKYVKTRHNLGFMAIDKFAKSINSTDFKEEKKRNALVSEGLLTFPGQKKHVRVLLVKPLTFMNNSGETVAQYVNLFKVRKEDQLWILHDDLDIDLGTIRIRTSGSSGGQKGVQSVIEKLGTDNFIRFRLGIRPKDGQNKPSEAFVLESFSKLETETVEEMLEKLMGLLKESCDKGVLITSV